MTLLASTLRKMDVLVTADGRSISRRNGVVVGIHDQTQKIFPVQDQPIVIAHHGQNHFWGHPIGRIVKDFAADLIPGLSITAILDRLREALHAEVRDTLTKLPPDTAAGCWIVGFGRGEDEPEHAEVFWKVEGEQLVCRENHWRPTSIMLAGSGSKGLRTEWAKVVDASVATVQATHERLFEAALQADVHPNTVGGHIHELLILPHGWQWTRPPASAGE